MSSGADETVEAPDEVASTGGPRQSLSIHVDAETRWIELSPKDVHTIGRDDSCSIVIRDSSVSRRHARLRVTSMGVEVEDLGSRNGTRVAGSSVTGRTPLAPGEELSVGRAVIVLHGPDPATHSQPGLLTHGQFMARLRQELDRSARFGRPLCVAVVRPERGELTGTMSSMLPLFERVSRALRSIDVMGHYGGGQLELLFPETSRQGLAKTLSRLAHRLRAYGASVHVGAASFPEDGASAESLLSRALATARPRTGDEPLPPPEVARRVYDVGSREVVIESDAMRALFQLVDKAAQVDIAVLIQGETGVGKEIVAEAVHYRGSRRESPLVKVNCAALPAHLLEAELFGYERGAFTGAERSKSGLFEEADGGSIFFDEIGDLPLELQVKLLRVTQDKVVRRIGASEERRVDVRVISATNRDLSELVQAGKFREDLWFRLSTMPIVVPPLRERREEIPALVDAFLSQAAARTGRACPRVPPAVMERLMSYEWPGNVRELENLITRAVVLGEGELLTLDDFPEHVAGLSRAAGPSLTDAGAVERSRVGMPFRRAVEDLERELIVEALVRTGGNQTKAARALDMPRRTLVHKMKQFKIRS